MPFTGSAWGPNYSSDQSYGVQNTNTGRAGGVPNTGGGSNYAGAVASVAGAVISGFFESRNQARQMESDANRQAASARYQSYMQDVDRYNQQQDRAYVEGGIAEYGREYTGRQPVMAPPRTNPGTRPVDPYTRPRG